MKVTDEMVQRAEHAYVLENGPAVNATALRDALEAALADVPEPDEGPPTRAYLTKVVTLQEEQLVAAEAKLAKVRAVAEAHASFAIAGKLFAILDEP